MDLPGHSRPAQSTRSVKRRALLTTAWAAPVAVATTASPAIAASPSVCPELQVDQGSWLSLEFDGVTKKGKWQKKSKAAVKFSLGDAKDYDWGALAFTADMDDVLVAARAYVFSLTWEIDMKVSEVKDWSVTKAATGKLFTYTFTYTGSPIVKPAATPLGYEPDGKSSRTFIRPVEFKVKVNQDQFENDETVSDGRRDYPVKTSYRVVYDVDVPGDRCDLTDQVYTRKGQLSLRPD